MIRLSKHANSILLSIAVFFMNPLLSYIDHQSKEDSTKENTEVLAYTSETVVDTVNPEWNEFGNPIEIAKDCLDEKGNNR